MDLCLAEERRLELRLAKRWWEQEVLELKGMWMAAREEEREEGEEDMDGAAMDTD